MGPPPGQPYRVDSSAEPAVPTHAAVVDRRRAIVENIQPAVDSGRFPIKRVIGESVDVTADIFADGHEKVGAVLLYRRAA